MGGCCSQSLMGYSGRSKQDQKTNKTAGSEGSFQRGDKDSREIRQDSIYTIFLCLSCPEILSKA